MLDFAGTTKFCAAIVAATVILAGAPTQSRAQTTGTVRLHVVRAGFIVGAGGGHGTLVFHGRTYRLSVGGVSVGSLGVSAVDLVGTAHNLRHAGDIAGTYGAAGAGLAIAGGGQVARLQNANGVVLELRGMQIGFQASLGLGGITIALR
jgi:hypothetical protein